MSEFKNASMSEIMRFNLLINAQMWLFLLLLKYDVQIVCHSVISLTFKKEESKF